MAVEPSALVPGLGGLNWCLVALANFDLVAFLTGSGGVGGARVLG